MMQDSVAAAGIIGSAVAYRELWRERTGSRLSVVVVRMDGSREIGDRPDISSDAVTSWLHEEDFAFLRLLPPRLTTPPRHP
jgi:hypothetical protein